MAQTTEVWHTQAPPPGEGPEKGAAQPECSICYSAYDNVFKTPKLLACAHAFCLECMARLAAVAGGGDREEGVIACPLCRRSTPVPPGGPPALPTCREVLRRLPAHQRRERRVWLEGGRLCYELPPAERAGDHAFCVCIEVDSGRSSVEPTGGDPAAAAAAAAAAQSRPGRGTGCRFTGCKQLIIFIVVTALMIYMVLWPPPCVFSSSQGCSDPRMSTLGPPHH